MNYNDPYGYNEYIGRLGLCRVGVVGWPVGHSVAGVAGWCAQEAAVEWIFAIGFEVQHKRAAEIGANTEPVSDFVGKAADLACFAAVHYWVWVDFAESRIFDSPLPSLPVRTEWWGRIVKF